MENNVETLDKFEFETQEGIDNWFEETPKAENKPAEESKQQPVDTSADTTEKEPQSEEKQQQEEIPTEDSYYTDLYRNFRELGVVEEDYNLPEGNLTSEDLLSILNEEKKRGAQKYYEENIWSKIADDKDAVDFINYKMQGGKTSEFFRLYGKQAEFDFEGDIANERYQDAVIRKYLTEHDGMTQEEVEEQLEMLETSGKKEKYAKRYHEMMLRDFDTQKSMLQKQKEIEEQKQQEAYKQWNDMVVNEINSTQDIYGMKLDKKRRESLYKELTQPLELQDGSITTPLYYRLNNVLADPKKMLVLADLLMNDLNIDKYKAGVRTQVAKEIRRDLQFNRTSSKKQSGNEQETDWFD